MSSRASKGLSVSIFKNAELGMSSNGGMSSICHSCTIVSDDFEIVELFEATVESPAVVIMRRDSNPFKDVIAVPRSILESGEHYMFGGSFIYTSDSRFSEISKQPIKLFDRVEN